MFDMSSVHPDRQQNTKEKRAAILMVLALYGMVTVASVLVFL
jgi:hypothetical protein